MLPTFLKDSYKQYKDDTDRFATWLVNTAQHCGALPGGDPDLVSAARASTSSDSNRTKSSKSPESKYLATSSQLRTFAEAISNSGAVQVPRSILAIARRAIALRKEVTAHFLGLRLDPASNKRHARFTTVLEDISSMLEPKSTAAEPAAKPGKGKATASAAPASQADDQAWLNKFAALTVDEVDDNPASSAKGQSMALIKVEVVEEDEAVDQGSDDAFLSHAFFRLFCLFHDLQNWRDFIAQTWTEYCHLKIDVMTASVVTDTALQFARDLIQEVVDSWPSTTPALDDIDLQELLFRTACLARGEDEPVSNEVGLELNENMGDVFDWLYLVPATLLSAFIPVIKTNSLPVYKPGYFAVFNPKADRANMSIADKFNEDKGILMELLPEFCAMSEFNLELPVQDEITNGLISFVRTKKTSLWLSFAVQILLDVHRIVCSSRLGAFGDLRMSGLRIARTIDDFWKLSATHPKPQFWPAEGDEEIKRIRECVKTFIEQDPFLVIRQTFRSKTPRANKKPNKEDEHLLFKRNPVLSGLLVFHLNLRMQTVGQALVNQWYDVQQLAFLYNLVQKTAPGPRLDWPDMDMFIHIHGEHRIFIGDRPRDAAQSLNRLEAATGISSVTRFASDSRRGSRNFHPPDFGKSARVLEPTTKVANLFRDMYMAGVTIRKISSISIAKVLDELSAGSSPPTGATIYKSSKDTKVDVKGTEVAVTSSSALARPQGLLERKWRNTHNIGTLQLLAVIRSRLCEEEPVLQFNYFSMHRHAINLLRLIRDKEDLKFTQYFNAGYLPDESFISNIVLLVHHVARGSAHDAKQLGLSAGRSGKVVSRIVVSSGDVMKDYLKKNGDAVCRELRTFCKNKAQLDVDNSGQQGNKEADKEFMYWFALEEVLSAAAMESLRTGIPLAQVAE